MFFSLIKEINMYVKHLLLRGHSQNFDFIGKKIWRNALPLKSKKVQGIFGETFILALLSSAAFRPQKCVSDFF